LPPKKTRGSHGTKKQTSPSRQLSAEQGALDAQPGTSLARHHLEQYKEPGTSCTVLTSDQAHKFNRGARGGPSSSKCIDQAVPAGADAGQGVLAALAAVFTFILGSMVRD